MEVFYPVMPGQPITMPITPSYLRQKFSAMRDERLAQLKRVIQFWPNEKLTRFLAELSAVTVEGGEFAGDPDAATIASIIKLELENRRTIPVDYRVVACPECLKIGCETRMDPVYKMTDGLFLVYLFRCPDCKYQIAVNYDPVTGDGVPPGYYYSEKGDDHG